jgi:hypothetical protein
MAEALVDMMGTVMDPYQKGIEPSMASRPDTNEAFGRMQANGHTVTIATTASVENAHKMLTERGIRDAFGRILHMEKVEVRPEVGRVEKLKLYGDYLRGERGLTDADILGQCMMMGDEFGDCPVDAKAVTLVDVRGNERSAILAEFLFNEVLREGSDDIFYGYLRMREKAKNAAFDVNEFGVTVKMFDWRFMNSERANLAIPVMQVFDQVLPAHQ